MEKNNREELLPCPLCPGQKKKRFLVCTKCHQEYLNEVASLVPTDQVIPSKAEWGMQRIQEVLPILKEAVIAADTSIQFCKKLKKEAIEKIFQEKIKGRSFSKDVINLIRKKTIEAKDDEVWKRVGGPKAFRDLRTAQARLQEAYRLLDDLALEEERSAIIDEAERILEEAPQK